MWRSTTLVLAYLHSSFAFAFTLGLRKIGISALVCHMVTRNGSHGEFLLPTSCPLMVELGTNVGCGIPVCTVLARHGQLIFEFPLSPICPLTAEVGTNVVGAISLLTMRLRNDVIEISHYDQLPSDRKSAI